MTTTTFDITINHNHPAIEKALAYMAAHDQDHATTQNGVGFNGRDTDFGCSLAQQASTKRLSDKQHELACKMLWRYNNTQLAPAGISLPVLGDLQKWLQERERIHPYKPITTALPPASSSMGQVFLQDGQLAIRLPSDYWVWVPKIKSIQVAGRTVAQYQGATRLWLLTVDWLDRVQEELPTTHFDYTPEVLTYKVEQEKRKQLAALQEEMRKAANAKRVKKLLDAAQLDDPLPAGFCLKEHQKEAARFVFEYERVLIGDEQGVGKTYEALVAAKAYQLVYNCEIICAVPVSVKQNWYNEAARVGCKIQVVSNSSAGIPKPVALTKKFVLIADESHAFKNPNTLRTKAITTLAHSPQALAVIFMTGTPIPNGSPTDIYPTLKALQHPLGASKAAFERRYCGSKASLRELYQVLTEEQPVMIRRKLTDVTDLPPFSRQMVDGVLTPYDQSVYDARFKELQEEYNQRVADSEISSEGWELVLLNHLRHAGSTAKINTVVDLALQILQGSDGEDGEQVVIFTVFKDTAKTIEERLQSKGFVVDVLSGDTKQQDRDPMVQRFQKKQTDAIVCLTQAGGVGITLTAASKVILADRDWRLNEQAESRVNRISQTKPTTAYWVSYTLIDQWLDNKLIEKAETSSLILEGYSTGLEGIDWSEEARNLLAAVFSGEYKLPTDSYEEELPDYDETF